MTRILNLPFGIVEVSCKDPKRISLAMARLSTIEQENELPKEIFHPALPPGSPKAMVDACMFTAETLGTTVSLSIPPYIHRQDADAPHGLSIHGP